MEEFIKQVVMWICTGTGAIVLSFGLLFLIYSFCARIKYIWNLPDNVVTFHRYTHDQEVIWDAINKKKRKK